MKKFSIILFVLFLGSISYLVFAYQNDSGNSLPVVNNTLQVKEDKVVEKVVSVPDYVVVTFAGDVMMDRGVEASVKKNLKGDYSKIFENFDLFKNDDISFVNLEGPVSDVGHNVGSKYSFRMDPKIIPVLKGAGIDIVSFANNHIGDYTVKAFVDTLKRLKADEILFAGAGNNYAEATTPTVIEKNNIKTCFLGYSDVGPNWMQATATNPGILIASDPNFSNTIKEAKLNCDALIVSFHWGDEYKPHTKRQESLAHLVIDSGADIVVGAHPHVPQDIETYNDKLIMYSLGNFVFDQSWSKPTMQGMVVQMKVYKDGSVKDVMPYTTQQNKFFQIESTTPRLD